MNVAKNPARRLRRLLPPRPPSYNSVCRAGSMSLCRRLSRPGRSGRSLSDLHDSPVTSHKSRPLRNPFRIRFYRNLARNSFRIRSDKTTQGVVGPPLSIDPTLSSLCRRQPRPCRDGKSLSGLHKSPATSRKSRLFMGLRALFLSCSSFSHPDPLFSITSALFVKNTRGGIPLPGRPSCSRNAKTRSCKSFACHSYRLPVA